MFGIITTVVLAVIKGWLSGIVTRWRTLREGRSQQRAADTEATVTEVEKAHEAEIKADSLGVKSGRERLRDWSTKE